MCMAACGPPRPYSARGLLWRSRWLPRRERGELHPSYKPMRGHELE